ncbi:hypothetical protein G9A89_006278 [Geosiphon pyriformis]|nr:hypothetical protein G9A89_006278 [Geosiphon pyriformis]
MATTYIAKIPEFTGENNDTSPQEWLDKVQKARDANTGLKNKLIKKVCPHAPEDLATAIRHTKNYEMAIEEANHTKLVNLAIGETSLAAEEKINQLTKKTPSIQQYQVPARKFVQHNPFTPQNQNNNNRINPNNQLVPRNSGQQRPNHYYIQPNYLTMPKKSNFQQPAFSEGKVAVPTSNSSNNTILPAQIAQNANLSDIFPFEFEANKSPFLLSNTAVNEQKTITAMYTKATFEEKPIQLILDSGSTGSIITYQLMQQLQKTVDRLVQTVIVTADGMKKTPVGKIDNFSFTIDGITIPVKVLVMDALQYQALIRNNWLLKANANLNWKTQELKISYQGQYTIVSATSPVFEFEEEKEMPLTKTYMALGSTSNWAEKTEQKIFEELRGWKKIRYSTPESWKQPPYIPLKYKDCNKKLSSMGACISPEEEYETHICYFCKACHRERFGYPKKVENGTKHLVLYVEIYYQKNATGLMLQ